MVKIGLEAMEAFRIEIDVTGLEGDNPVAVTALVDTWATHSMMPASLLTRLGIRPTRQRTFTMADGRTETYDIGAAMISVGEEVMPCPVIFGREGRYLLGATTLENFDLAVDPVNQKLTPVAELTV